MEREPDPVDIEADRERKLQQLRDVSHADGRQLLAECAVCDLGEDALQLATAGGHLPRYGAQRQLLLGIALFQDGEGID